MDTITSLVGVLETALEGGEPTTSLSSLNALYALHALQNRAEAAEAEVGRLQAALDQWKQCGDAIMLCATGRAAPLSDWDDKCYANVMAVSDRVILLAHPGQVTLHVNGAGPQIVDGAQDAVYTDVHGPRKAQRRKAYWTVRLPAEWRSELASRGLDLRQIVAAALEKEPTP